MTCEQLFQPDLDSSEDRGERHNCCVALDAVIGDQRQVVFLTDDSYAIRDYVAPVFDVFPLWYIWSSCDFILYLFLRHRRHITQDTIRVALKDIAAKAVGKRPADDRQQHEIMEWMQRYERWRKKLEFYYGRVVRADLVLNQVRGGR